MSEATAIDRVRIQRNYALAAAAFLAIFPMAVTSPRFIHRYRRIKAEQVELVRLQATISAIQFSIRYNEAKIIAAQNEIRALEARPH